jgi:hypothetical protein
MFVADTNHHRIAMIDLARGNAVAPLEIGGLKAPASTLNEYGLVPDPASASFPRTIVRDSQRQLIVDITLDLPPGHKINDKSPMSYRLDTAGDALFDPATVGKTVRVERPATHVTLRLPLQATTGQARLTLRMVFYYCQEGVEALCRIGNVTWSGALEIDPRASASELRLQHAVQNFAAGNDEG